MIANAWTTKNIQIYNIYWSSGQDDRGFVLLMRRSMLRPWDLAIQLQYQHGTALHRQIVQAIIEEIRRGRLARGAPMPGTRELAERLSVNRKTVVLAYEELVAQGWLEAQARRGTFVAAEFPVAENGLDPAAVIQGADPVGYGTEASMSVPDTGWHGETKAGVIDFNDGVPDSRMIPYAALARAFRHALIKTARNNQLGYGDPRGALALRQSLARMLNLERGLACNEDTLCLVRGSQMGIYLAARVLVRPGDAVAFEALSYAPAREAFRACGATLLAVGQDQYGLIPDELERLCRTHRVRAVYVTPHHQYPTTVMMPAERRLRLLALAEQFDFAIVEDDYDHEFHFDHRPMLPMASIDRGGKVIYIGSMSKGLAPGLRVGYVAAARPIVDRCAATVRQIDRQGNAITELAVNELLESGELKRHLRRALRIYAQRRDAAVQIIRSELEGLVEFDIPPGGLALWLRLCNGQDASSLTARALAHDLRLVPSEQYATHSAVVPGIRIGYASLDPDKFAAGIRGLRAVLMSG